MSEKETISRKRFLAILGGTALTFVAAKVSSAGAPLKSIGLLKKTNGPAAYGNSSYGGRAV